MYYKYNILKKENHYVKHTNIIFWIYNTLTSDRALKIAIKRY